MKRSKAKTMARKMWLADAFALRSAFCGAHGAETKRPPGRKNGHIVPAVRARPYSQPVVLAASDQPFCDRRTPFCGFRCIEDAAADPQPLAFGTRIEDIS